MKIGFTCSTFDLFHAGHVAMLEEAKGQCDYLIVGIQSDPTLDRPEKNKPVQNIIERQLQVRACKFVDETIVYNTEGELFDLLCMLPINIRILGEEYIGKPFTGNHLTSMEYYYNKRDHGYSSSELRKRIENAKKKDQPR